MGKFLLLQSWLLWLKHLVNMLGSGGCVYVLAVFNGLEPLKQRLLVLRSIHWSWIKALNFRDVCVGTFETNLTRSPPNIHQKSESPAFLCFSVLSGIKNPLTTRTFNLTVLPFWTLCEPYRSKKGEPSFSLQCLIILSSLLLPSWGPNFIWGPAAALSLTNHPSLPNRLSWTQRSSFLCSELWLTWTKNDSLLTFNLVTFARAVLWKNTAAAMNYNLW